MRCLVAKRLQQHQNPDRYLQKHLALTVQQWLSELKLVDAYDQVLMERLGPPGSPGFQRLVWLRR